MRLFNRRKEMEFDDPRLVGMAPLKATEENFGHHNHQTLNHQQTQEPQQQQQSQNLAMVQEEESLPQQGRILTTITGRKSSPGNNNETHQLVIQHQPQDKYSVANGGGGVSRVSTWKRVSRPWDSLRRSESTEHLSRSIMSSTSNRRKTLHFYQEFEDKFNKSLPRMQGGSIADVPSSTKSASDSKEIINPVTTKRKLGRVESLRLLLSKSNRIYRGSKGPSSKSDKGTDTQDLDNDTENSLSFPDDISTSKYSTFSSLNSTMSASSFLNSTKNFCENKHILRQLQLTKATSCENLSYNKNNGNQGITLPGHRDMSTSTYPLVSCMSQETSNGSNMTTGAKRSSFPYAYIKSRLTSLQEEPKVPNSTPSSSSTSNTGGGGSNTATSTLKSSSSKSTQDHNKKQQQKCSLASKFMHKGFYHSMGNLLTPESTSTDGEDVRGEVEEDFDDESEMIVGGGGGGGDSRSVNGSGNNNTTSNSRIFDPLKQIRIDLLHRNPSEFDDHQSPSPTFWGRRSYSIGDILEKRKVGKSDSSCTGVEESGYDSDSTRNGHESPRNSIKSPSSETENELNESDHPVITGFSSGGLAPASNKKKSSRDEGFESQSTSESSSPTVSSYSFPASGCLITINRDAPSSTVQKSSKSKRNNNTKEGAAIAIANTAGCSSSSVVEIVSDLNETDDFYSSKMDSALESNKVAQGKEGSRGNCSANINHLKTGGNEMECEVSCSSSAEGGGSNEKCASGTSIRCKSSSKIISGEVSEEITRSGGPSSSTSIRTKDTDGNDSSKPAPSLRLRNRVRDKDREWNGIRPSRSKSLCLSIFTVSFNKGPNKKSLGFSVIGGKDSPVPGIFVKRIFPYGQASEEGGLSEGDEILSVNGQPLANCTHAEALTIFKSIKAGDIVLEVARREFLANNSQTLKRQYSQLSSKSCEQLHQAY